MKRESVILVELSLRAITKVELLRLTQSNLLLNPADEFGVLGPGMKLGGISYGAVCPSP